MFSVENEEEAKLLITLACSRSYSGEYIARELAEEQTLDNLKAFSDRLENTYDKFIKKEKENG